MARGRILEEDLSSFIPEPEAPVEGAVPGMSRNINMKPHYHR